jgi:hypothetical protein
MRGNQNMWRLKFMTTEFSWWLVATKFFGDRKHVVIEMCGDRILVTIEILATKFLGQLIF